MKIDTMLAGLEDAPAHARRLEQLGVDGAFTFEGPHDVFTPLILAAGTTTTLELATNVAIAFPRNPVQLAHQAYDLQLLTHGRFSLGLGSQIRTQVEKRYGASFDRPIARMRELVGALRAIFATWETGERLNFRGEFWSHTLMPPMFNPGPNPYGPPPIAVGALGPQMLRLASEVADGVLVMPFNTATHFASRSVPAIDEGLARGDRDRSSLVVTGEGRFDGGSLEGKVVVGVAHLARTAPLLVLCGSIDDASADAFTRRFAHVHLVSLVRRFGARRARTRVIECVELAVTEEVRLLAPG